MSQRVVDGLEPIEIEAVQRQSTTATRMRQGLLRLREAMLPFLVEESRS